MDTCTKPAVAVYCSAADRLPEKWIEAAEILGRWIGDHGATLVYGGVDAGLMKVVARAVKSTGSGAVVGVVPELRAAMSSPFNDKVIAVKGLAERKELMCEMADTFVVLPGGYGTLDELATTLAYLRFNSVAGRSIILYNPDNLYDHLLDMFDVMITQGLMALECLDAVAVATSSDEMISLLQLSLDNTSANYDKK